MERISRGGQPAVGFALGAPVGVGAVSSVQLAALMTGATAGLLVYVFKGPLWGSIVAGSAVAAATKYGIESTA